MSHYRNILYGAAAIGGLIIFSGPAEAVTTLTLETSVPAYQQQDNSPCVIGEPSCSNDSAGELAHTILPVSNSDPAWADFDSPLYYVSDLTPYVDGDFWIGIDINQTHESQSLVSFSMLVNNIVQYLYTGPTDVPSLNNGNGFSDYILKGFSLTGLLATDTVQFNLIFANPNDGREQFFLIDSDNVSPIPLPPAAFLLFSGLAGIGLLARKRKSTPSV